MLTYSDARPSSSNAARGLVMLGFDAAATVLGLYCALVIDLGFDAPGSVHGLFLTSVPALLAIRLAAALVARLHGRSFMGRELLEAARLALTMLVASVPFAILVPGLSRPVYVLECFLTVTLMASYRFALPVWDEFDHSRFPEAEARFVCYERPRRALNVLVAVVGLLLTLPVWALIAAAIKLTSRGPVLYRQERVGLDLRSARADQGDPRRKNNLGGRPFMMYKFRTMRVDAEAGTGPVWSGKDDPRVTPVGRFLRHCRLDELPQLLNVLKGDMNVVGPRPERATIFADLREQIPGYHLRQKTRPGITGYAQVNLEYDSSVEDVIEKLKFDAAYVRRQSVAMDLQIMAKTLPVMLFREKVLASRKRRVGPLVSQKTGT